MFLLKHENPPKKWKKKYGYYMIDDDETIYIAGILTGRSEMDLLLCASYDGEPLVHSGGKNGVALFRARWLKTECPKASEGIDRFVEMIRRAHPDPLPNT